jgi:hypothetical protein
MLNDEIIDEVRAIRDAHAAKFGYDLRAIYADLKRLEAEHIAAGHPFVPASPELPVPNSALQRTRFAHR